MRKAFVRRFRRRPRSCRRRPAFGSPWRARGTVGQLSPGLGQGDPSRCPVGESVDYALGVERHGYLVPATGAVEVNGIRIEARDGAAIKDAAVIKVTAIEDSELVLVDTP
jgi:hypothetical protein